MENIDTSIAIKPGPAEGTAKSMEKMRINQPHLEQITPYQDAAKLRADTHESRVEATKNLETIRTRLKEISASLNEDMGIRSKRLKFSVDESTNRMLVKVLDKESGELIRQIPSEAILKVAHSLEALKGILFDDKY
jgi:flagellar protein FlaG